MSEAPLHSREQVPEANAVYPIETVEKITHISKERIVLYYQHGLVRAVETSTTTTLFFDDRAVHDLRRISFLLSEYGINQEGLHHFFSLMQEVEKLREEVRFLRQR